MMLLKIIPLYLLMGSITYAETPRDIVNQNVSKSIMAFRDICLNTAPSFSEAVSAAKAYGITDIIDMGFMKMGLSGDKSIGVQVKENKECTITTPAEHDDLLTKQFLSVVSEYAGSPTLLTTPTKITIRNKNFTVAHDRKGGEAYVILNSDD